MTIPEDPKYPKTLTNAYWQTKKSFKDKTKAATKTGLGAALTAAENAWKAIPFAKLDAKQLSPKSVKEAQTNLANAKTIRTTQVKAASQAIEAARLKAIATGKNAALSDTARSAAQTMATQLSTLRLTTLGEINVKDLELAVGVQEAKAAGGTHLQAITINRHGSSSELGSAPKAVRSSDTVTIANITWQTGAGDPKSYLKQTLTLHSKNEDNSLFSNDMVLTTLSTDTKTATFKA
jgi:hypothetical protein